VIRSDWNPQPQEPGLCCAAFLSEQLVLSQASLSAYVRAITPLSRVDSWCNLTHLAPMRDLASKPENISDRENMTMHQRSSLTAMTKKLLDAFLEFASILLKPNNPMIAEPLTCSLILWRCVALCASAFPEHQSACPSLGYCSQC
jgi:hypothetical protein